VKAVKMPNGSYQDLIVAGNKDGRLFALNPDTGKQIWVTNTDPGGIYGGLQFGRATDGKRIYFGTTNSQNMNRNINLSFVAAETFLNINRFTPLGIRVGLYSQGDDAPFTSFPAPSSQALPFPGPNLVYGINDYPQTYPAIGGGPETPFLQGPASGPKQLLTLKNPPSDVTPDGITVISSAGKLKTINGTVQAVDAATGNILWQRPAYDGIKGSLKPGIAFGTLTVGNGMVFIGYQDGVGTMVALDAHTGVKLFQFQNTIPVGGVLTAAGSVESGPQVVGRRVYWGIGAETFAPFPDKSGVLTNGGNRLYSFKLPNCLDDEEDNRDQFTDLDD
ncbi:MAG: PQQ-binding-like beta-propeller repeat protein, partial [Pseudomonadota bacterium]|nr:PQQ-binding-like beta-propeller repeat protein [Pseudomonadota bacterium]